MLDTRVKIRAAFVIVFLLGFAAGALSLMLYARRSEPGRPAGWARKFDRERYVKQLTEAVGLQAGQMGELNSVLDQTREEFIALRTRLQPQFDEVRERARERIRGILTAEQQPRFEAFVRRWDEERRAQERAASGATPQGRNP